MARKEERGMVRDDALFGHHSVLAVEGCATVEAFVQNDADAPEIAATVIRLAQDHLGRHVLARSDHASRKLASFRAIAPVQEPFYLCVFFRVSFAQRRSSAGRP